MLINVLNKFNLLLYIVLNLSKYFLFNNILILFHLIIYNFFFILFTIFSFLLSNYSHAKSTEANLEEKIEYKF